jgi:hypothetical protein
MATAGPAGLAFGQGPSEDAGAIARTLESDPVYVAPGAAGRLPAPEQGRVRLAIVKHAIGRVKVVVAAGRGGAADAERLAREIDRAIDVPGALIVVAGPAFHVITSHPRAEAATSALRTAVERHSDDSLEVQLTAAVERIGAVDPGAAADLGSPAGGGGGGAPSGLPDAENFLDRIGDAFRLGVLIVAGAIALPFLLAAIYFVLRVRRSRAHEEEVLESGEAAARSRLVALGDGIRSLDIDTSMPGADRGGLADYEQALARYDQANALLAGEPSAHRVQEAQAAIEAGERHIGAAQRQLDAGG